MSGGSFFGGGGDRRVPVRRATFPIRRGISRSALLGASLAVALMAAACARPGMEAPAQSRAPGSGAAVLLQEKSSWLTFGDDPAHESINTDEKALTATASVPSLAIPPP